MYIRLRVHASSKKDVIEEKAPDFYEVWVREPALNGRANASCLALLSRRLGIPAGKLRIVKGGKSPAKIVEAR